MSKLKTNTIRHVDGSNDNITLDSSQNVTVEGNTTVDGTSTLTGNVTCSGKLLVGSTDGATYSDTAADDLIIGSTTSGKNDGLTLLSNSAQNGTIAFADQSAQASGLVGYVHNGDYLRFHTGGAIRARLDSDGLKFGSDTAANTALDDYEEGTFTPAWKGASNHGTTSYGDTNTACYTKIGNIVHVQGYSKITGNSGGSGGWIMDNLPFPALNDNAQAAGSLMMYQADLPAGSGWANVYAQANTSNLYIYNSEDNGVWQQFTIANDSAAFFIFQITYTTSS